MRVAVFASCAADLATPGPVLAAVRVLEAMGMVVEVPRDQGCCGQVALNSGHAGPARRLMRDWLEVFDGFEAVVGISGSCTATVHHHLPRMLTRTPGSGPGQHLTSRVWEFTQFVARYGSGLDLALIGEVTWHDSCHMLRTLGEKGAPREVLGRVRGLRLREADGCEVCCGFGGTFALKYPELSCAMADRKLDDIRSTGATHVVSSDATCLMHLAARADHQQVSLRPLHVAELLAAALPGGPATLEEVCL